MSTLSDGMKNSKTEQNQRGYVIRESDHTLVDTGAGTRIFERYFSPLSRDALRSSPPLWEAYCPTADAQRPLVELEKEKAELELRWLRQAEELKESIARHESAEEKQIELKRSYDELVTKHRFAYLLQRVCPPARQRLLETNSELRQKFEAGSPTAAFVMSIDIRRSTELMLKAREPHLFACFVTDLWQSMKHIITENFGVFDKFTGDGILAFFPEFYSGASAGYFALKSACQCHALFADHYRANRKCFASILRDAGVGVGIDYGDVQIVNIGNEMTVVGQPVVYACRLGGAKAGQTLLNQGAYEQTMEKQSSVCNFEETSIPFKHDGETIAYAVTLNEKPYKPQPPEWLANEVSGSGNAE